MRDFEFAVFDEEDDEVEPDYEHKIFEVPLKT